MITRQDLLNFPTHSSAYNGSLTFELKNNASTDCYFVLAHKNGEPIFNEAEISSLVNCSVVTSLSQAGFIIYPNCTASFSANFPTSINKEDIVLTSTNVTFISGSTTTYYGVNLTIT